MRSKIDLTGQRFGQLTAKEYVGHGRWRCSCSCGGERIAPTGLLRAGRAKNCIECSPKRNRRPRDYGRKFEIGETVGFLTLEKTLSHNVWLARCLCGRPAEVTRSYLTRSTVLTCRHCAYARVNK